MKSIKQLLLFILKHFIVVSPRDAYQCARHTKIGRHTLSLSVYLYEQ